MDKVRTTVPKLLTLFDDGFTKKYVDTDMRQKILISQQCSESVSRMNSGNGTDSKDFTVPIAKQLLYEEKIPTNKLVKMINKLLKISKEKLKNIKSKIKQFESEDKNEIDELDLLDDNTFLTQQAPIVTIINPIHKRLGTKFFYY